MSDTPTRPAVDSWDEPVGPTYRDPMTDFAYTELLPIGPDTTPYRLLTTDGVSTVRGSAATRFFRSSPRRSPC